MPRLLMMVLLGAIFFGGLMAPNPYGPALLALVALFVGWLAVLSLPQLHGAQRFNRLLLTGLLIGLVAWRIVSG